MNAVIYIHGKGGSATESEHYKPLFPHCEVMGLDYQTFSPWDAGKVLVRGVKDKGDIKNTDALNEAYILGCSI